MQRLDVSRKPAPKRRYLAIAQQLLNEIQRGEIPEGGRLPADRDLASRFEVSRTTLREAAFALELVGILDVRHGDGTYVTRLHQRDSLAKPAELDAQPEHVIDSRLVLEPPVCSLIAAQQDVLNIDILFADLDDAEALIDDIEQLPTFVNLALKFHGDLVAGCPNTILSRFASELVEIDRQPLWLLINQIILQDRATREQLVRGHRDVLHAILSGDSEVARQTMRDHLEVNKSQIFLQEGQSS